jgi:hypothetical protein
MAADQVELSTAGGRLRGCACRESVSRWTPPMEAAIMDAQQFMKRLRDLHKQIAENSAKLKTAVAAGDHAREAKVRADISGQLDEIDRIKAGQNI